MFRDLERRNRHGDGALGAPADRRRMPTRIPVMEQLEGRQLLSYFYSGATAVRPIQSPGGVYTVTMNGPGLVNVSHLGHGVIGLKLYGTTSATTVDVALTYQRLHQPLAPLQIGSIKVLSGQVGAINAGDASLLGTVTPLMSVSELKSSDTAHLAGDVPPLMICRDGCQFSVFAPATFPYTPIRFALAPAAAAQRRIICVPAHVAVIFCEYLLIESTTACAALASVSVP